MSPNRPEANEEERNSSRTIIYPATKRKENERMKSEVLICIDKGKVWVQNKPKGISVRLVNLSGKACIVGSESLVSEEIYTKNHTVEDLGQIKEII